MADFIKLNKIDYTELMKLTNNNIPIDFFKKYSRIQMLNVKDKIVDHFIKFIQNCLNLKSIIQLSSLNSILSLIILEDIELDFKFIYRIKKLNLLVTRIKEKMNEILND